MGSRLSLRVQIVAILALVIGAEAALSSLSLSLVLPKVLAAEDRRVGERLTADVARRIVAHCHDRPLEACAATDLQDAMATGVFAGLAVYDATSAMQLGAIDGTRVETPSGKLSVVGWMARDPGRAERLFGFHLANLAIAGFGVLVIGVILFNRAVARPVEQLAAVADRIGHLELSELSSDDAPMLGQLTSAFERMARALKDEQARVGQQIAELTRINRELAGARESIIRQENLATVGRLAAGVAHEVGNPLGGILGYAEILKFKGDPVAKEYAERIEREVARIDATVRGLLDFSRPKQAELAPIALEKSVERALALCKADRRFREVEPRVELPPDLRVQADEHRIGQVLVNLLLNAGDAMAGKGTVFIRARRLEGEPPRLELTVEDTGPGIPADVLPKIFDPFFSTKDVGQGTGLGLSICASIMDAFGGDIRAENRAEGGARFVLTFRAAM